MKLQFRVYSDISNSFIYFTLDDIYGPRGLSGVKDGEDLLVLINRKVQQYTGLKDKNGTEIYEGDLLNIKAFWDDATEVIFAEGMFGFTSVADTSTNCMMKISAYETEIIGNIYETPVG